MTHSDSKDDWYMTGHTSDLAVIETSHGINNKVSTIPPAIIQLMDTLIGGYASVTGSTALPSGGPLESSILHAYILLLFLFCSIPQALYKNLTPKSVFCWIR